MKTETKLSDLNFINNSVIKNVLDISTRHAPLYPDFESVRFENSLYGWVVWVTEYQCEGEPEWMAPILDMARKNKCIMINFDRDAEEADGLKLYEW